MAPNKHKLGEFERTEEHPKGSNKWRVALRDGDQRHCGPIRVGPNAKALAEEDLRRARETESRAAMFHFVGQLHPESSEPAAPSSSSAAQPRAAGSAAQPRAAESAGSEFSGNVASGPREPSSVRSHSNSPRPMMTALHILREARLRRA